MRRGRPSLPDRIIGRYEDGRADPRGRQIIYVAAGARCSITCESSAEADRWCRRYLADLQAAQELTIDEAIGLYLDHLRREGRSSVEERRPKLRRFFAGDVGIPISSLTPARCQALYADLVDGKTRYGSPIAVSTHQQLLRFASCFLSWCVGAGHLKSNPAAQVKRVGVANAGKEQLRLDEAARWLAEADRRAAAGDAGAAAAMTALLLGLRAGAILSRTVRDLDAGGTVLWLPRARAGSTKRTPPSRPVPEQLRPHLLRLAEGRASGDLLFPCTWRTSRTWLNWVTRKICQAAGVPVVCPHSFRGLHATILAADGAAPHIVAAALGNTAAVAEAAYIQPGTVEGAAAARLRERLQERIRGA